MAVCACRQNALRCRLFAVQLGEVTGALTQAALCAAAAWQPPAKAPRAPKQAKAPLLARLPPNVSALAEQLIPDQVCAQGSRTLSAPSLVVRIPVWKRVPEPQGDACLTDSERSSA